MRNGLIAEVSKMVMRYLIIDAPDICVGKKGDKTMGGKWSVEARNLHDKCLQVCWYGNNFIQFLLKCAKSLLKYDVVILGKHG